MRTDAFAKNTTCNVKISGSGCCSTGAICSDSVTCFDQSSSNCTNSLHPHPQCCPANIPFCRDFASLGVGCYGSSMAETFKSTALTLDVDVSTVLSAPTLPVMTTQANITTESLPVQDATSTLPASAKSTIVSSSDCGFPTPHRIAMLFGILFLIW